MTATAPLIHMQDINKVFYTDEVETHALAGVQVSIHDMGATPAVVSLRLDQAVAELSAGGRP